MTAEGVVRRYADILQRILTEQTHGDFTAIGFCVEFAEAMKAPDFSTHRGRVEWVRRDPACVEARQDRRCARAINRLRSQSVDPNAVSTISLVDARDAVYNAWGLDDLSLMRNEWVA